MTKWSSITVAPCGSVKRSEEDYYNNTEDLTQTSADIKKAKKQFGRTQAQGVWTRKRAKASDVQ